MLEFIAKYWLQFLFGLIAAGAAGTCKYFYNLYKKEKARQEENKDNAILQKITELLDKEDNAINKVIEALQIESRTEDSRLQAQIDKLSVSIEDIRKGILDVQGFTFKDECRRLLVTDHVITPEEWDLLNFSYKVYKGFGGNHDGDRLFKDVETKYRASL